MINRMGSMEPTRNSLVVDIGRCTGCRRCQIACAMQHFNRPDPRLARVQVLQFQEPELNVPVICMACDNAPCIKVCPVNARVRGTNHSVDTAENRCIGCGACIFVCPVGSPMRNPVTHKTMTCDMCGGWLGALVCGRLPPGRCFVPRRSKWIGARKKPPACRRHALRSF